MRACASLERLAGTLIKMRGTAIPPSIEPVAAVTEVLAGAAASATKLIATGIRSERRERD